MAKNIAVVAEVEAAQAFLKALGAPWQNTDLIYAVVAWIRKEGGGLKNIVGNNPFNLRPGAGINRDLIKGVRNGRIIFTSLKAGLIATAQRLLRGGFPGSGFRLIVAAARNGQAVDFLNAVALSAWDAAHYGYADADTETNRLYQIYITFTGLQMPSTKQPKKVPQQMPIRPRDLNAPIVVRNYIDPSRTVAFYRARHQDDHILRD